VKHDEDCPRSGKWFKLKECQAFSTDGTVMGAVIAHQFGTTDDDKIIRMEAQAKREATLTGMDEEQADWEAEEDDYEPH
jgi:hypothetical protein